MRPRRIAGAKPEAPGAAAGTKTARRWLIFIHQLPTAPSNLRVRTWRRLQQLGAVPVKQAVYVLPDTPAAREDFEWLKTEVNGAGGEATVFAADNVDSRSDHALIEEFRRSRQEAYMALAKEIDRAAARLSTPRRSRGTGAPGVQRLIDGFGQRLTAIERVDFFGSAGRDRATAALKRLADRSAQPRHGAAATGDADALDPRTYTGRVWVTRPRPGVDRMASAWLIKRFVDPRARFAFAADKAAVPADAVPFDMFGVDFTHRGDGCTFETLCASFGIRKPAVSRLAAIVHDLDLKDARFGAPEAATVGALIEGLQISTPDDDALLAKGMTLFESLCCAFEQASRTAGPRPVAAPRKRRSGPTGSTRSRRPR